MQRLLRGVLPVLWAAGCGAREGCVETRISHAPEVTAGITHPVGPTVMTQEFRQQVFLVRRIETCVVGDPCTHLPSCITVHDVDGGDVLFQVNSNFRSVSPEEQTREKLRVCLGMDLRDEDVQAVQGQVQRHVDNVAAYTHGGVLLDTHYVQVPLLRIGLNLFNGGFWLAPFGLQEVLGGALSVDTDFILLTHGIKDFSTGAYVDLSACGLAFGADFGLGGAGYAWVPRSSPAFPFECAEHHVYTHEWLHQVEFAQWNMSGFTDRYLVPGVGHRYPPCGQADAHPHEWFPTTHECTTDPDSPFCGGVCGSNDAINRHILTAHFDRSRLLVANHCRNNVRDFSETGVDSGGRCDDPRPAGVQTYPLTMPLPGE